MEDPKKCLFSDIVGTYTTFDCRNLTRYESSDSSIDGFSYVYTWGVWRSEFGGYNSPLTKLQKLNFMSAIIEANRIGFIPVLINKENVDEKKYPSNWELLVFDEVKNREIRHDNKGHKILELSALRMKNKSPFDVTILNKLDLFYLKILDETEAGIWIYQLLEDGYIDIPNMEQKKECEVKKQMPADGFRLSPKGWAKISQSQKVSESNKVFIAMAFTDLEGKSYGAEHRFAIKSVLSDLGYEPLIIDEVEHNDGIMEKIISYINKSAFLIADLTFHKNGVYYEAGYAKGLGLPVILMVREDHKNNCHFDVRHLNQIIWKDYDDLKEKLKNRIEATLVIKR